MLDSAPADTARPARTERPARTRGPDRTDQPKQADRSEPRNETRRPRESNATNSSDPTKPAPAQETRQAKNGQPSEIAAPVTETAAPANAALVETSAAPEFAAAAEAALADATGEGATETAETDAKALDQTAATDGDVAVIVSTDGAPADATVTVAVAVVAPPPLAPANTPVPTAAPSAETAIAPVAPQAAPPVDTAPAPAPVTAPAITGGEPAPVKPQADIAAPVTPAAQGTEAADDSQKGIALKAAGLSEAPETKTAAATAETKAEPGTAKPEHASAPRDGQTPAHSAKLAPAATDEQPKVPTAQQPQAQVTEHRATARPAPAAEARVDLAATSAAQAPSANISTSAPLFPLPLAHALPHAMSPLVALRLDTASANAIPVAGLAVEIVARATEGSKRFEIRLDPPELGRIDVRLDVDTNGKVTSRLVVERTETLDLLRRDQHQLERALQHAGLNSEGGLEFSLRDQNFANRDQTPREAPVTQLIIPEDDAAISEAARRNYGRLIGLGGGVDIRV